MLQKSSSELQHAKETIDNGKIVPRPCPPIRRKSSTAPDEISTSTKNSGVSTTEDPEPAKASTKPEKPPVVKKPHYLSVAANKLNTSQEHSIKVSPSNSKSEEELPCKKKSKPKVPAKNPELEKLSVHPLKPCDPN